MSKELENRSYLAIACCGPIASGKSTLFGSFANTTWHYSSRITAEGSQEPDYALAVERADERACGKTLRWSNTLGVTAKWRLSLINVPESVDLLHETISGLSQADAACLVVDPHPERFDAAIARGGEIDRTCLYLFALGVKQLIVSVNKMDTVGYSESRFNEVVSQVKTAIRRFGFNPTNVRFFPTVATTGENVESRSSNMPWSAMTMIDAVDAIQEPRRVSSDLFRGVVVKEDNREREGNDPYANDWLSIHIESSFLKPGQEVVFYPTHAVNGPCEAKVIYMELMPPEYSAGTALAGNGDCVLIQHSGLSKERWPRRGDVVVLKGDTSIGPVTQFTAKIIPVFHDGQLAVGDTTTLYLNSAHVQVRIAKIERQFDPRTGETIAENPASIGQGANAIVLFEPLEPLVLEKFQSCPQLGRLLLSDSKVSADGILNLTVGQVTDVVYA